MKRGAVLASMVCVTVACGADDEPVTVTASTAALTAPAGSWRKVLLPNTYHWQYYDGPDDQGTAWRTEYGWFPWESGPGPFGYGQGYLRTFLAYGPNPALKPPTAYFRREHWVDPSELAALELHVMYDDGFVLYLGGEELVRRSMPAGPVSFSTLALGHDAANRYERIDLTASLPRVASHGLLAAEVHQASRGSSDLVFDAYLVGWMNGPLDVTSHGDVPRQSYWHFWDRGDLGTAWRAPGYADASWSAGEGPLGFGETYLTTPTTAGLVTTYFRKQFEIDGAVRGLRGEVMYDDGFVIYLNGIEIGRSGLPSGTITAATNASGHEADNVYRSYDWSWAVPLLTSGTNTLAVEVHQAGATSSDLVFDLALEVQRAWTQIPGGSNLPSGKLWFTDMQRGWHVADGVRRTVDGGRNWTRQTTPAGNNAFFREITFVDAQHGWIVGDDGVVLATTNGGESWVLQSPGTTNPLVGVSFVDAQSGFVLSPAMDVAYPRPLRLYRTTNGGANWTEIDTGIVADGGYVFGFADAQHGWIAGTDDNSMYGLAVHATSDGGATWTVQWQGSGGGFSDLEVVDAQTVWIVGMGSPHSYQGEEKLVTRDGGATWTTPAVSANGVALAGIDFVDPDHGFAVGFGGSILATADGGVTWDVQRVAVHDEPYYSSTEPHFHDVHFVDAQHGWALDGAHLFVTQTGGL
jgi:photosystem II stability/assembly factor-like uncharacterized protein